MKRRIRMNLRVSDFAKTGKPCVYRYIDKKDGIVKYVGIVYKQSLQKRIQDHLYNDEWCKNGNWKIEYFECETKSEVEAFEAHLIALYKTEKYFNKVKSGWGINRFLPDVENWWKPATIDVFEDDEVLKMAVLFRNLLRNGEIEKAKKIFELFEFNGLEV